MSTYKVDICGVNTSKLPILKEEEKEELFKKIKAGDQDARDQYIRGNLRLVLSVIKRFHNHNENADDLFQIGCIGILKAIDKLNGDKILESEKNVLLRNSDSYIEGTFTIEKDKIIKINKLQNESTEYGFYCFPEEYDSIHKTKKWMIHHQRIMDYMLI